MTSAPAVNSPPAGPPPQLPWGGPRPVGSRRGGPSAAASDDPGRPAPCAPRPRRRQLAKAADRRSPPSRYSRSSVVVSSFRAVSVTPPARAVLPSASLRHVFAVRPRTSPARPRTPPFRGSPVPVLPPPHHLIAPVCARGHLLPPPPIRPPPVPSSPPHSRSLHSPPLPHPRSSAHGVSGPTPSPLTRVPSITHRSHAVRSRTGPAGLATAALGQAYGAGDLGVGADEAVAGLLVHPDVPLAARAGEQQEPAYASPVRRCSIAGRAAAGRSPGPAGPGRPSCRPMSQVSPSRWPRAAPTRRPPARSTSVVHSCSHACTSARLSWSGGISHARVRLLLLDPAGALQGEQLGGIRGRRRARVAPSSAPRSTAARRGRGPGGVRRSVVRTGRGATRRSGRGRRRAAPRAPRGRARRRAWCRRGTPAARLACDSSASDSALPMNPGSRRTTASTIASAATSPPLST